MAAALAAMPWRLAERTVERHLLAQLSDAMGLALDSSGDGAFALLPTPRMIANDVVFTTRDGAISARIPRMRAEIRLLALMAGRIAFDQITLIAPQIEVAVPAEGVDLFSIITSLRLAQLPGSPQIAIRANGSIFFRRGPGIISSARDVSLDIAAREIGEAFQTSGSLTWRGEKVSFAVATNSPMRATLPMASIKSNLLTLDFVSARVSSATPASMLDGSVAIAAPSMSRLGAWLASGSPVLLPFGKTDIRGEVRVGPDGAQIRNAVLTLGGDPLEGALDWRRREGRWRLTGTFAGQNLDIGRAQAGIDMHQGALPDLAATSPIDIDDLLAHDIDLRVSVQRMRFPRVTLSEVAAQIMATDKRLDIALANAGLYRGSLRGRASIGHSSSGVEIRSTLTADKVDLGLLSADLFDARRLTGQGTFQQQLEMNGRSPAELVASAEGRAIFTARNGDFLGTNLNELMRRMERQPLAAARDMRGGRTSFEQMTLAGTISEGVLMVTEARGAGPAFRMALEGRVSLIDQIYRLQGEVQSSTGQAALPFEVLGSIGEPMVQVNARSLLERSGAAAPFLRPRAN
jgi:AsmA protein